MKVLVACEESQAVTKEFRRLGHEAYSCDIIECSGGHPEWHIMGDVLPLLNGDCVYRTMDGYYHRTFGKWDMVELSEANLKMVFIPRGFAHGFCTLTENAHVLYKVDNYYSKENERGIIWDDSELKIVWPVKNPVLSDKDLKNLTFKQFKEQIKAI